MHTPSTHHVRQDVENILEKVRSMQLPDDEDLFSLEVREKRACWQVSGIVGPFARRIEDGEPYPVMCMLPLYDIEFSSKEEVLDFARKVHDVLVERGKQPEAITARLLGLVS